jgi:hypothetical protein
VRLGPHVTLVRVADGLHDLVLSAPEIRARVLAEIARWTAAYVEPTARRAHEGSLRLGPGPDTD